MSIFGLEITWIELFGVIFNLWGVWLTIRKSRYCFPVGIIGVSLYVVFYFQAKLYADTLLQLFYIGLLAYGWSQWGKTAQDHDFKVTQLSLKDWLVLAFICIGSTMLIGTLFSKYTDAALPYLDSLLMSMSLVAQYLIAKKKLENWIVWIVADVIYVGLFVFKKNYPTSILYFIFILLAIWGYASWKKKVAADA